MNSTEWITIISSVLEGGAVVVFITFVFRALKSEIKGLNKTVAAQNETLKVMEKRVQETEKIGEMYRKFINDLPNDIEAYQTTVRKLKDEVISSLSEANESKDEELKRLYEIKLGEINKLDNLIQSMPKLRNDILGTLQSLEERLEALNKMESKSGFLVAEFINRLRYRK